MYIYSHSHQHNIHLRELYEFKFIPVTHAYRVYRIIENNNNVFAMSKGIWNKHICIWQHTKCTLQISRHCLHQWIARWVHTIGKILYVCITHIIIKYIKKYLYNIYKKIYEYICMCISFLGKILFSKYSSEFYSNFNIILFHLCMTGYKI